MSLNIFPDLLTNVEITRIIGEILKTTTSSVIKSPRIFSKDSERKESTLSFSDFEKMMVKIAVKAFKNSEDPVSFCINKIYRKIILMSKCIYFWGIFRSQQRLLMAQRLLQVKFLFKLWIGKKYFIRESFGTWESPEVMKKDKFLLKNIDEAENSKINDDDEIYNQSKILERLIISIFRLKYNRMYPELVR